MSGLTKSIYIPETMLNKITTENTITNKRILDLINKGLLYEEQANPKYIVESTFNSLRELLRLRDNKEISIKLVKK